MLVAVSTAWKHGSEFGPGTIVVGAGEDFSACMDDALSRVATGTRLNDAVALESGDDGGIVSRPAIGKMHRHGKMPGELVCPACGSLTVEPVAFMDGWLTCEKNCYGKSGSPGWKFEGHYDPDGEGPPEEDVGLAEGS